MIRLIGSVLVFCMVFSYSGPALAEVVLDFDQGEVGGVQEEPDLPTSGEKILGDDENWMMCHQQGKIDGGNISTAGSTVAGVAGGVILGLIGTGIVVLLQSKSDPPQSSLQALEGDQCQYAYIEAFKDKSVSKKRTSALIGGLIGTAVFVIIYVSASGD